MITLKVPFSLEPMLQMLGAGCRRSECLPIPRNRRDPEGRSGGHSGRWPTARRAKLSLGTILLIVLVLVLLGVIPTWPHSKGWGYAPSGIVGVILLVLVILVLMGRL